MSQSDRPKLRLVTMTTGLLTALVGVLLLAVPAVVQYGKEWIIAGLLLGGAVTTAGFALTALRLDIRVYTALLAALSLVTAVIILVNPLDRFITLTTLLGFYFMIESGLMGGLGMSVRPNWTASFWMFSYAIVSFFMSALIWLFLAGAPKKVLVGMLAISFILRGLMYVALSILMKGRAPLRASGGGSPEVVGPSAS
jgi:uncharacterized membrane protein HdeD (DUF308 family)